MPRIIRSGRAVVWTLLALTVLTVVGGGYYWYTRPDSTEALRLRIRATSNSGDWRTAITLLREMAALRPNEFKVHYALADHLYFVAKEADPRVIDPPEAIKHLLEASRIEPRNVMVLERLLKDFTRLGQTQNAGEISMRLVKIGRVTPERTARAVRYAIETKDVEFLKRLSEELTDKTLQEDIVKLAVRIGLHEAQGMPERIYWEAEPALQRIQQNASVKLQALDDYALPFLGMILEASVRYAPTGAIADRQLNLAVSLVTRLSIGELGQAYRLELVEMAARPVSAALRSRAREGLDADATAAERSDPETRRRALQKFVDLAEPAFGTGIASPFVYEQISRAALELENDQLAISMLRRGILLHAKLQPENRDELMSVHAQSALRLISRGKFEPLREDIVALSRYEQTEELSTLLNGLMAFQQGQFESAYESLASIPENSPHRIAASGLLIRVLLMQNRWDEALTLIDLVDQQWPKLPEVTQHWLTESAGSRDRLKLLQAGCLLRLGRIERAVEVLSYLDESPLRSKSRLIRLIELMRSGNSKRAWEVLRIARTEDPHDFDLLLGEFGMLMRDKASEGAFRLLKTFVKSHQDLPHAQIAYAGWLRGQSETASALEAMAAARAKAPETVLVWLLTADLLMTEQRARELGPLVAEMQKYPAAIPHIPVVHTYALLKNEQLDEAAAAMLESSFEAHSSNGYTTPAAMVALAEGKGDPAYEQFARTFSISPLAARDRDQLLDRIGSVFANIDPAAISVHVDLALDEFPVEPSLLMAAVELALRRGAFETASARIDTLEAVDAVPGRAGFMRARMLSASGLHNKALEELQKVLKAAPMHARARLMAARLEYADREYSRALVELRQLTYPISDSEEAVLLLGRTLAQLDRSDEAIDSLTKRVQRTPQRVEPWLALAQVYASLDRLGDSRAVIEQAMQFHRSDLQLQDALIDIHMRQGSSDTAASLAQSFGGPSPDLPNSMRFARAFLERGEPELAANWIGRAHMAPNAEANGELVFLDALMLHERGVRSERWELLQAARRRYESLLQRQPGHVAALNGLARLLIRDLKAPTEGVAVVEQIRTVMPLDRLPPEVQATVSEAYRRAGRPVESLTIVKRSINRNPDAAVLRMEYAAVLLDSFPDDPVKAREAKEELKKASDLQVPANRVEEFKALSARLNKSGTASPTKEAP